jgi:DNA-binding transcriptional ArsR family regulator
MKHTGSARTPCKPTLEGGVVLFCEPMVTRNELDVLFKAVADPTRRSILELLRDQRLAAGSIAERFPDMSRPAISKHLRILREVGLVEEEQEGRQRYYHLTATPLTSIVVWVENLGDRRLAPRLGTTEATARGRHAGRAIDDWRVW